MPSADKYSEESKGRVIKSAFDSESFESDGSIHVDGVVGSATISPSGRDIALGSAEGLAIIDLDSPYSPPRRLRSPGLPWLVVDVQWSPFAVRDYWVVSTANHRALVWNLNMREDSSTGPIEHSLQGHSRAITDVNFSAHHPDLLATCSVDGYVHSWDLRRPRQPVTSFCDWFAGATQVKYNRQDPHIVASAHDRYLHIWDDRRPSEPLKSITAHTSKIYGIDWNRTRQTGIVTCSLDKSIKFWDYSTSSEEPEHVIRTPFPVWRARHTPFGWGLLAMPQNEPGNLYLYDRLWSDESPIDAMPDPVAIFDGHGEHQAKEFLWRSRGGISDDGLDNREFQLVSWGDDNQLRLNCVDEKVFAAVGHYKGQPARKELKITRKGATYKTYRTFEEASARDRKAGTMSDQRTGNGIPQKISSISTMRSNNPQQRLRSGFRGSAMKARVSSAKTGEKPQTQIGWMKGITMVKRKTSASKLGPGDPNVLDHGFPNDDWGEPDTVQEELLRISTQLPKITFENIDMDKLSLSASLNGPWGTDGESIFIKVKIDIPSNYPKDKAPKFNVEKTSFMAEKTHKRIQKEIHELADQFLRRKQNCLEVAFTYLLGEVDLESSTTFFKNVRDLDDDDMDGMADDSSSEDEDSTNANSASMSQELGTAGEADTTIAAPNRTMVPPPPRTCGARFSNTGQLICFFPSKEEKARALFSSAGDLFKDRVKGEPFFAGFGRIAQTVAPRQRFGDETSATEEQTDASDTDDASSVSSSSDSESTSIHNMSIWYRSSRQLKKTWSEDRSVKSSGAGTGTGVGTGTGTGTSRRRIGRPRNVVTVHDLSGMLPSKRELANGYSVFGDGAEVCEHNAQVAERFGSIDLMHVWKYLALLLRKGIPLQFVQSNNTQDSILVIARDATSRSAGAKPRRSKLAGRVKWGEHPLARTIIADLFHYFESMYDIQMLAMLSCIFSESTADDSVAYVARQLPQRETPLPLKAPSFSLDYFPPDAAAWLQASTSFSNSAVTTPAVTTPGTLHTPLLYGSQASEEALWAGETNPNSYSRGETPPSKSNLDEKAQTSVLSKSPTTRTLQRTSTGLAMALTANLTRPFTTQVASSPPQVKKKPSPAEAILSSLAPRTSSSGATTSLAVADSTGGRPSLSEDDYRNGMLMSLVPINVAVILEDQSVFDDDGWLGKPLLEPAASSLHARYRYAYAEMLQMWEHPIARLEVMKFNVIKEPSSAVINTDEYIVENGIPTIKTSSPIVMGKKDRLHAIAASGRGLDVTGICHVHETQLEPVRYASSGTSIGGAVGTCDRCHKTQSQLRCVYCLEPVDALFPPCLSCGCASHQECLAEWHSAGETMCPAGDECNCVEEATNGQVESWVALKSAMLKGHSHALSSQADALSSPTGTVESEKSRLWRKADPTAAQLTKGTVAAAVSPSLGFGAFKRAGGTWGRMGGGGGQKKGNRRL